MTIGNSPVISRYRYRLTTTEGLRLIPSDAYRIYAWMLSEIPSEYAELFHQDGETPISQHLSFNRTDHHCYWTISLLSAEVSALFSPLFTDTLTIQLNPETIDTVLVESKSFLSGEEFILENRSLQMSQRISLLVQSTLAFKQAGKYIIFPQEQLILHSLISKWNQTVPEYPIDDEDAIRAICSSLQITDYSLHTNKFRLKGVGIPGCVGKICLSSRMSAPLFEVWSMLAKFAEYSGLGIKTTLGMGGVELVESELKE